MASKISKPRYRLGVDIGGTFTDLILLEENSGETWCIKVLSTPDDPFQGVKNGIARIRSIFPNGDTTNIEVIHHGMTVATNSILERKGAKVALVTTEGFRQILQIARASVPSMRGWNLNSQAELLAPLELTVEVPERMASDGSVVRPVDITTLRERLNELKKNNPETITVSLINSFANPKHEREVLKVLGEIFPDIQTCLSSQVLPELQEYERTLTAVANSYVKPLVSKYLSNLKSFIGTDTTLRILKSDGGLSDTDLAIAFPVNHLMSGPAGGVAGVTETIAKKTNYKNLITLDMGGTSTDIAVIKESIPQRKREIAIGSLTLRVSSIDIKTIGAGGGSIAHVPQVTKALRVGPESAGIDPGPAAYGRGGNKPTVTDAYAVLGYLPATLLGGEIKLDVTAAENALLTVAGALKIPLHKAAQGIIELVNENIYGSFTRLLSVEQSYDPTEFSLVALGGAGPLHANAVGSLLGSWPVIIPPSPGVLCAYGAATTRLRHEAGKTFIRIVTETKLEEILEVFEELLEKATFTLESENVAHDNQAFYYEADLRYKGQGSTFPIKVDLETLKADGMSYLSKTFATAHEKLFTFSSDTEAEIVNLRAITEEKTINVASRIIEAGDSSPEAAKVGATKLWIRDKEVSGFVFDRSLLKAGNEINGPSIITELDSTTLVLPDHVAVVDDFGNILIWPTAERRMGGEIATSADLDVLKSVTIDPILVEVIESALRNARYDMDTILFSSAMSPAIREQRDEFPMITDPNGRMVVGQFGSFIGDFIKSWSGTIEDGDVFFTSDPYSVAGSMSQTNNWLVFMPIFRDGMIIGYSAMFGHMVDVGGKVPGSLPMDARSIYEEGVLVPIVKLFSKHKLNPELLETILYQCRMPAWNRSDLNALIAACHSASRRVNELCDRFETKVYLLALEYLLERNKKAMKRVIETLPDERLTFMDYVCDDGLGAGPFKIQCSMFKKDGILNFDFTGTDPQSDGSINYLIGEKAFKMFAGLTMFKYVDSSVLFNDGCYDLMNVHIPEGLLAQRAPRFYSGAGLTDLPYFAYFGFDHKGKWFQMYSVSFGGTPGQSHGDGLDGHSLWPSFSNVPNEYLEANFPLRIERFETIADSGGPGFFRGGNGVRTDYYFLEDGEISIHDDRWLIPPWGIDGALPGGRSKKILCKAEKDKNGNNIRVVLPSKCDRVVVKIGDVLEYCTWGGGGCGDPYKRDSSIVLKDIKKGLITIEGARRYGVVVTPELELDRAATANLRAQLIEARTEIKLFDFGPDIETLRANCLAETGLPPPVKPTFKSTSH